MKKLLLLLAMVAAFSLNVLAQNVTVKGVVTAESDGEPIIGASVQAKGTSIGTMTDLDGRFVLSVPASCKKLVISFVGMYPVEVDVQPNVSVELTANTQTLEEVVVTGYGTQKKAAFTGAASVVEGDVVDRKSDVNFVKSLEGNVTGFQYNNSTSMPGMWGSVYIRGMGSLSSSSQPLYVIDGVPVNSDYDSMYSYNNYFDPMAAYNPNDIESITVLKDAAATAIYGSRAANGVIVITTKKGGDSKLSVTFETRQGFTTTANNNMKYANAEQTLQYIARSYVARYTDYTYDEAYEMWKDYYMTYYGWDGVSSTDWIDTVSRKGYYADYNLSLNGTSGKTNYYINLNYNDATGNVIYASNKRYGGRVNVDSEYKWLTAGMNVSFSYSANNSFSQSTSGTFTNPLVAAVSSFLPFYSVYNEDGSYANVSSYNPLAVWDEDLGDLNEVTNKTLVANPWAKITLPYGFYAKTSFGYNSMDQRQYVYWGAVYNPQGVNYNGLGQWYISNTTTMTWTNTIGWDHSYGDHTIDVLLGQEMQKELYYYDYYAKSDFPFADLGMRDMTTAASDDGSEYYKSESRLISYFMDAHYDYANKYYLSASVRRDGSSRFGSNNRWGNFWSVGAKWRLSQEKFLADNAVISNADIRVSYGTVGNQGIGYYVARGYYAAGYNYLSNPGMVPYSIANPNLTWETSRKFDAGFDLSFLSRWHLTFDFYNEDTADALYAVPLSMTTGMASSYKNIGKIRNRGIEIGINGAAYHNKDVVINVFANASFNKNKVVKLADGEPIESTYTIIEEGRPYRQFYMKEYAGVDPETGRALYYLNEEGDETTTSYADAAKRYVGSAEPKVFGAFGTNGSFYGFDYSIQFNYRLGAKVFDSGHAFTGWGGSSIRTPLLKVVTDSWTPDNTTAKYPQLIYGDPYTEVSSNYSSRWLMSGDYLRLSNITFGYTLPAKITRKAQIQKVRIYTTLDNVYTWTASDFTGYSPDTYASGIIAWQYPAVSTFTGGIQVTF